MAFWNHRVVNDGNDTEEYYSICRVFYNEKGEIQGYSATDVSGDSVEDLREALQWMLECLDKPVLVEGEFEVIGFGDCEDPEYDGW